MKAVFLGFCVRVVRMCGRDVINNSDEEYWILNA